MERPSDPAFATRLFGASPERALALVRAAWPGAVGAELARRTEVVGLERGLLRVRVPDAGWRRQLVRLRRDILVRLRGIAGGVAPHALGFVEGPVTPRPEPPRTVPLAPAPPPPTVASAAQAIPDPEIRTLFLAAAGLYLARFGRTAVQAEADPSAPSDSRPDTTG